MCSTENSVSELLNNAHIVKIGECELTDDDPLVTYGLGSCLMIALTDVESNVGGIFHALLPSRDVYGSSRDSTEYEFVREGIHSLYDELVSHDDVDEENIVSLVAGGLSDDGTYPSLQPISEDNAEMAKQTLESLDIPINQWAVGGDSPRTAIFSPDCEMLIIRMSEPEDRQND